MKKILTVASMTTWLENLLPGSIRPFRKQVPWYRRTAIANVPWIAVGLMLPLMLFLLIQGVRMLLRSPSGTASDSGA